MHQVLTVCLGNYCRSPFAALALAKRGAGELEVRSAACLRTLLAHAKITGCLV
ncbi:hypothetical protein H4K36_01335 [Streptomyces sp. DHE7-1]|nr:hypothetical protein [Streptomyces sp. DHE7-1]